MAAIRKLCWCFKYAKRIAKRRLLLSIAIGTCLVWMLIFKHEPSENHGDHLMMDLTLNKRLLDDVGHFDRNVSCRHPALHLWPREVSSLFSKRALRDCHNEDWIYTHNGTFYISKQGVKTCTYHPITFHTDYTSTVGKGINFVNGTPLVSDFFEVHCNTGWFSASHQQTYAGISRKLPPGSPLGPQTQTSVPMNILMVGFDSISRLNWIRNLPETYKYLVDELDSVVLEGYNIVGDGTPQALLPILTGHTEEELSEARWGRPGAREVDGHPWIWYDFQRQGYVTQWGEDYPNTGTFQYRMKGFARQPVHHYYRSFLHTAYGFRYWLQNRSPCLGGQHRHVKLLEWCRQLFVVYPDSPKFSFIFQGEISHNDLDAAQVLDLDVKSFLSQLKGEGHLDNTVLILMADHGLRAGQLRRTEQGKFEERLPFFSIRMPDWFRSAYPETMKNLNKNAYRLTTPFDIHATFKHLLKFRPGEGVASMTRGISLLTEVPTSRTCRDAAIAPHWCSCMDTINLSTSDDKVVLAAQTLVSAINTLLADHTHQCSRVSLRHIISGTRLKTQDSMLKFRHSKDTDGRIADLSDTLEATETYYQVIIETEPGEARFEATLRHDDVKFVVDFKSVSRINLYGNQPACLAEQYPHLRKYCYCY